MVYQLLPYLNRRGQFPIHTYQSLLLSHGYDYALQENAAMTLFESLFQGHLIVL